MKDSAAVVALELVHVVGHLLGLLVPVPVEGVHLLLQAENKIDIITLMFWKLKLEYLDIITEMFGNCNFNALKLKL